MYDTEVRSGKGSENENSKSPPHSRPSVLRWLTSIALLLISSPLCPFSSTSCVLHAMETERSTSPSPLHANDLTLSSSLPISTTCDAMDSRQASLTHYRVTSWTALTSALPHHVVGHGGRCTRASVQLMY